MTNSTPELEDADCILITGSNTRRLIPGSQPDSQGEGEGAKLIVIDPRKTQIACYADIFRPPRLGTDGVDQRSDAHHPERRLEDKEFIASRTEGRELKKRWRSIRLKQVERSRGSPPRT